MRRLAARLKGLPRDSGMSTVEMVFLAPLLILMIVIIAGLGIMVNTRGVVNEAARDAARAGSLQGDTSGATSQGADHTQARAQAMAAARADLGTKCSGKQLGDADVTTTYIPQGASQGPGLVPIAYYRVTIKCTVNLSLLSVFGGSKDLTASFTAPINTYQSDTAAAK